MSKHLAAPMSYNTINSFAAAKLGGTAPFKRFRPFIATTYGLI
jgi:hypothetical protein